MTISFYTPGEHEILEKLKGEPSADRCGLLLRCLELALSRSNVSGGDEVLALAGKFAAFVEGEK